MADLPAICLLRSSMELGRAERSSGTRSRQPSLLAGILFDPDGNRMTPTHAVKSATRYRYYVSHSLITKDQSELSPGLRLPAAEIEQVVTSRLCKWLLDPGSIYTATRFLDASAQRRLIARAAEIGKSWPELPRPRQRAAVTALIERIDVASDQIDIHTRPKWFGALLDGASTLLPSATDDETQILSVPVRLRCSGREIRMLIDSNDPCVIAKPNARLIKLLMRAHRFNAALVGSPGVPFAALAKQAGVSRSYFTRLVRLSYLAPDITQAILDGQQPPDLTTDKLLAHSRLPLAWQEQRALLGFA